MHRWLDLQVLVRHHKPRFRGFFTPQTVIRLRKLFVEGGLRCMAQCNWPGTDKWALRWWMGHIPCADGLPRIELIRVRKAMENSIITDHLGRSHWLRSCELSRAFPSVGSRWSMSTFQRGGSAALEENPPGAGAHPHNHAVPPEPYDDLVAVILAERF